MYAYFYAISAHPRAISHVPHIRSSLGCAENKDIASAIYVCKNYNYGKTWLEIKRIERVQNAVKTLRMDIVLPERIVKISDLNKYISLATITLKI